MMDSTTDLDASAVRERVHAIRRRMRLMAFAIYPVLAIEAMLALVDGRRGWGMFWLVLLAVTFGGWCSTYRSERRRDDLALAASDDAARAYLIARLDLLAVKSRKVSVWIAIGGVFIYLGIAGALDPETTELSREVGDIVLGAYFVASRLYARFVLCPWLVEGRAASGVRPPDAEDLLAERARAVRTELGDTQAIVFWRETTDAGFSAARAAARSNFEVRA